MLNAAFAQLLWFGSIIDCWLQTEFVLVNNTTSTYCEMIAFLFIVYLFAHYMKIILRTDR